MLMQVGYSRVFSGGGDAAQTTAFLARTSGLDATHTNAYKALINGLVSDGVWSALDALYMPAAQDSTTAALNLVSSSYGLSTAGSVAPPFTADRGYTGNGNGYLTTGFVPSTAAGNFSQDSASSFVWSLTSGQDSEGDLGHVGGFADTIFVRDNTDVFTYRINAGTVTSSNLDGSGFYSGSRTSSALTTAYKNGSSVGTNGTASGSLDTTEIVALNSGGLISHRQLSVFGFGAGLNATNHAALYTRAQTYLHTLGAV